LPQRVTSVCSGDRRDRLWPGAAALLLWLLLVLLYSQFGD